MNVNKLLNLTSDRKRKSMAGVVVLAVSIILFLTGKHGKMKTAYSGMKRYETY